MELRKGVIHAYICADELAIVGWSENAPNGGEK